MMRTVSVILLLAIAGLGATLAWEVDAFGPSHAGAIPQRHAPATANAPVGRPDHTPQWVATILARPLFSPTRRPPPAAVQAANGSAFTGLPRLSGVLVGPFGRSAIFANGNAKPLVVTEGAQVNGWVVRRIRSDAVELGGRGGTRLLHPEFPNAPPSLTSAPADSGQRIGWSLPR